MDQEDYFMMTITSHLIDTLPHVLKLVACNVLNSRNIMGHMTAMYQTTMCACVAFIMVIQ